MYLRKKQITHKLYAQDFLMHNSENFKQNHKNGQLHVLG